jgi:bacterioferritin-associated ferredoxin
VRDSLELPSGPACVDEESDHELRQRNVEAVVREWQLFRGRFMHLDVREAQAQRSDELGRRLGCGNLAAACHELARKRARASADIKHALSRADAGEFSEERR